MYFYICAPGVCMVGFSQLAYIPLQHNFFGVGALLWSRPPTPEFCVGDTNMLVFKNAKICVTPNATPYNASQWNKGCVGFQTQISRVCHVHFIFLVLISFTLGTQREPVFQWNIDLYGLYIVSNT